MELILIIIIIAVVVSALKSAPKHSKRSYTHPIPQVQKQETIKSEKIEPAPSYNNVYQRKLLFSKNEYYELKKLKAYANNHNLEVLAKVRLLDLVEPIRGKSNYQTLLHKIQAKHVDFVILDSGYRVKGIIEIDDNSHNASDRKERDNFVDLVLSQTGYKVLRTRSLTDEILDNFLQLNGIQGATSAAEDPSIKAAHSSSN